MELPVETIVVAGSVALAELERLRADFAKTGKCPLILGDARSFELMKDNFLVSTETDGPPLLAAGPIDPADWFARRAMDESQTFAAPDGNWLEAEVERMSIVTHCDSRTDNPLPEVLIGLVRVSHPWQAFSALRWGGWNDCPYAEEHAMIHEYWHQRYGAEVVSITSDVVQCIVARPPQQPQAAMELAREQYIYCEDIVDQGVQTVAALASTLLDWHYWYFWWD